MKAYGFKLHQGKTYKTVEIGEQVWFAENLDYDVEGSKCYDDDPANCVKYGRLYDWATAMGFPSPCNYTTSCSIVIQSPSGICPSGWHIPSDEDWDALRAAVGKNMAGTKLKATSGWAAGYIDGHIAAMGGGTNDYGFSALPGGFVLEDGSIGVGVLAGGYWWSANESNSYIANMRFIYYKSLGDWEEENYKTCLLAVRCVKDDSLSPAPTSPKETSMQTK